MIENKRKCIKTSSNYLSTFDIFNLVMGNLSIDDIDKAIDFFLNPQTSLVEDLEKNLSNCLQDYKKVLINNLSNPKYIFTSTEISVCFLLCEDTTVNYFNYRSKIRHLINDNLILIETLPNYIKLNSLNLNTSIVVDKKKILLKNAIYLCLCN